MGSLQRARRARNRHRAGGLVLLMVLSSFAAFLAPVQASIANDDVAISAAIYPTPEIHYDSSDLIDWTPSVLIENQYDFNADSRVVDLEICVVTGLVSQPAQPNISSRNLQLKDPTSTILAPMEILQL